MHMVFHTAYDNGRAIELLENAPDVVMQFIAQNPVAQERPTVLGRKDRVQENLG
jgi:hypothetical protein